MRFWAFLLIFAAAAQSAEKRDDFAYGAPIILEQSGSAYEASLPVDVYLRAAYSDLRDLRVFNGKGEAVPYSLRRASSAESQRRSSVAVPIFPLRGDASQALDALRVTISRDGGSINVRTPTTTNRPAPLTGYFIDLREQKEPIVALELRWPESAPEFSGAVTVAESNDLSTWHTLARNAPIVNLQFAGQRLVQSRIEFSASHGKFLRVDWETNAAAVSLQGAVVEPLAERAEVHRLTAEAVGARGDDGAYEFDVGLHAPVDRLSVLLPETNSLVRAKFWSRSTSDAQWRFVSQATVYQLQRDDRAIESPASPIPQTADRYWRMTIENKNGIGDGNPRLRVSWIPSQLVFVARGTPPFNLAVGSNLAERAEAPVDQIVGSRESETTTSLLKPSAAVIGDFVAVGGSEKLTQRQQTNWKNWTLWIALMASVAALGYMARRLLVEMGKPSENGKNSSS